MRISNCSSVVCSSDLPLGEPGQLPGAPPARGDRLHRDPLAVGAAGLRHRARRDPLLPPRRHHRRCRAARRHGDGEAGRALRGGTRRAERPPPLAPRRRPPALKPALESARLEIPSLRAAFFASLLVTSMLLPPLLLKPTGGAAAEAIEVGCSRLPPSTHAHTKGVGQGRSV